MRTIPISKGYQAIVDDADYERVSSFRWSVHIHKGARTSAIRHGLKPEFINGKRPTIVMSRFVLGLPPGWTPLVDHVNGDALDNRRSNLRIVSASQNNANRHASSTYLGRRKASRFKGVTWQQRRGCSGGRWVATITKDHRKRHLGSFANDERAAAIAYNAAAISLFGEFALLNEIEESA